MFPLYKSINREIFANIMSSGKDLRPNGNTSLASSELVPFVRVISGTGDGLIIQSNIDVPITSDSVTPSIDKNGNVISVKSTPSIYGNKYVSGMLGYNWKMEPVYPFTTPYTGDLVLRPSPIITDLEVKEGKDQISRSAKLVIKCFSLAQAESIQEYCMEPGHSLLIEYGWNSDRAQKELISLINPVDNKTPLNSYQISVNVAESNLNVSKIQEKRISSGGDYDSFFGFIVGGEMSSEGDIFVLSINLRGMPGLPSYLQLHQNIHQLTVTKDKNQKVISSTVTSIPEAPLYTNNDVNNTTYTLQNMGSRRWKWLFNKLPATRQTYEVTKIIDDIQNSTVSSVGWWDLINFDYVVADKIANLGSEGIWDDVLRIFNVEPELRKDGVSIPAERLVSSNRYIRFEKALEILNRNNGLMSYQIGDKTVKVRIQTKNFIGAFPGIFSTKPSKLIIPGFIPDFQAYYLNTNTVDVNEILKAPFIDNCINVSYSTSVGPVVNRSFTPGNSFPWNNTFMNDLYKNSSGNVTSPTSVVTEKISFVQKSSDGKGLRPEFLDPKDPSKGSFIGYYESDGYYGELGNLYINFAVFVEALKNSSNKSIREVLMDMLNEMSSAVNSFWNFQIVEGTDENGDYVLKIIDENWGGKNTSEQRWFIHAGEQSTFLDANLSIDIPSEMTNQIILKRQDFISNPDSKTIDVGGIFSGKGDKFLQGVNYVKSVAGGSSNGKAPTKRKTSADLKLEIEAILNKANKKYVDNFTTGITTTEGYDSNGDLIYKKRSTVSMIVVTYENLDINTSNSIGKILNDRVLEFRQALKDEGASKDSTLNSNLAKIDVMPNPEIFDMENVRDLLDIQKSGVDTFKKYFKIYCCDDTQLFDIMKNNAFEDYNLKETKATSHPLPIKYTFKILGRSGIQRGDIFNIVGIPKKYRDYGFFQVIDIEQSFTENNWTTTVTGQFRQQKQ